MTILKFIWKSEQERVTDSLEDIIILMCKDPKSNK